MFAQILSTLSESNLAAVMWSLADYNILPDEDYPEYHVPTSIEQCSDILESRFVEAGDIEKYLELRNQSQHNFIFEDEDCTDETVHYESAWECCGGLTPDEEWAELYAELND